MNFAEMLKDYLRNKRTDWTKYEYGASGCETCGYGADEYEVVDWDKLDKAIDEFCASFEKGAK